MIITDKNNIGYLIDISRISYATLSDCEIKIRYAGLPTITEEVYIILADRDIAQSIFNELDKQIYLIKNAKQYYDAAYRAMTTKPQYVPYLFGATTYPSSPYGTMLSTTTTNDSV